MIDIAVRYLHYLAVFVLAGTILIQNMAIKRTITSEDVQNLAKISAAHGIGLILVFAFGLILWLWVGKPGEFYSLNLIFHAKLGLFALLALLSIISGIFFFKNQSLEIDSLDVPGLIILCLRLKLALLVVIPVLASLMARGIGLSA
jgi:putative membrane protein